MDAETGLYYYRARYYSPALGRFLQTDPIGYEDGLNWYAYVGNDPLNLSDPTGECSEQNSGSKILCGVEDALTDVLETVIETAMNMAGVDVVPEGSRDPEGTLDHEAPDNTAGEEVSAIGDAFLDQTIAGDIVGTYAEEGALAAVGVGLGVTDSSKNERHGDGGRSEDAAQKQISQLEEKLKTATGKEKTKIRNKIQRIKRNAQSKRKGEEHSRRSKRRR